MKLSNPEVSVVMSVYNGAKYLRESVESILSQNGVNLEFIIVNDGSTDPWTLEILSDYENRENRIRVIHKQNEGLTKALIDGCKATIGDYIARIDVGDVMTPERLGKQKQILEEYPDCAFVSCYTEFCGPEWEHLWITRGKPASNAPVCMVSQKSDHEFAGDVSCHGSVMFRKTAYNSVGGYRKQFYYGQDQDLWYRLAEIGNFFIIPDILYRVRIFPEGISMSNKLGQDAVAECSKGAFIARRRNEDELSWIKRAASIRPNKSRPRKKIGQKHNTEPGLYFIGEALRRNGDRRCRPYFLAAMRQAPLRVRSYIRWVQSLI